MNRVYVNGHTIEARKGKLEIDGKVVDAKLKKGFLGVMTLSTDGWSSLNIGTSVSMGYTDETTKIKIGRNEIILRGNKATVNGKEIDLGGEEKIDEKTLDKKLNDNAKNI